MHSKPLSFKPARAIIIMFPIMRVYIAICIPSLEGKYSNDGHGGLVRPLSGTTKTISKPTILTGERNSRHCLYNEGIHLKFLLTRVYISEAYPHKRENTQMMVKLD
jgi:hypothetical protein